jgi:hypothetical protein
MIAHALGMSVTTVPLAKDAQMVTTPYSPERGGLLLMGESGYVGYVPTLGFGTIDAATGRSITSPPGTPVPVFPSTGTPEIAASERR